MLPVRNIIFAAALLVAGMGFEGIAIDLSALPKNAWVAPTLNWKFPDSPKAAFQERSWGVLRYNTASKSIVFYEGYGPSTTHGNYCIYGNALYSYNPDKDTVELVQLSNHFCQDGPPTPLAENETTPTPKDRHTYAQLAYAQSNNSMYLAHGASGSGQHPHDFWQFSFDQKKWINLGQAPGGTQGWECTCERNLIYNSISDELYLFLGATNVQIYSLKTKTWQALKVSGKAANIGAHGAFDVRRNVFVFFGNNWTSDNSGASTLSQFNATTNTWSEYPVQGDWPTARSYASLEYNAKWDVYVLHGGNTFNDTWIFSPVSNQWYNISPKDNLPLKGKAGTTFVYDPDRDLLIWFMTGKFFLMRFDPEALGLPKPTPIQSHPSRHGQLSPDRNNEQIFDIRGVAVAASPFSLPLNLAAGMRKISKPVFKLPATSHP